MADILEGRSSLSQIHPGLAVLERWIPFDRDQLVLLLVASNELFLGLDTYLSHLINGTIVIREWIPIVFGPVAGLLLLIAGLFARKWRNTASLVASLVLLASVVVGILGTVFHMQLAIRPGAPPGYKVTIPGIIWSPPVLGPLSFALVGWLGISAVWREKPTGSGNLMFLNRWSLQLPYSKSKAYYYIVSLGAMIATVSSVIDHARHHFSDPWMWFAAAAGLFATCVALGLALIEQPDRGDLIGYASAMLLLLIIGPLGLYFHAEANLTADGKFVLERFIRGAPMMAPLLFTNIGLMGILVLFPTPDVEDSPPRPSA